MNEIQRALFKTILYADIFDYPLKVEEIWRYLTIPTSYARFQTALTQLVREKQINFKSGYYVVPKRGELIQKREARLLISQQKMRVAQRYAYLLAFIPSVRAVLLTGSVARYNADMLDDIDLLIITAAHSLWSTRLLCLLLLDGIGIRRKPKEKRFQDKICLNMFMSEDSLALPRIERDFYSAHEVVQCVPLVNRFGTYELFLTKNRWIKKYLLHVARVHANQIQQTVSVPAGPNILEHLAQSLQLRIMRKKRTTEVITETMLRFHPVDARSWVREAYAIRLKKYHLRQSNEFRKAKP